MGSDKPSFDVEGIITDAKNSGGKYSCPICGEYSSDSIRSIKGHISGSQDEQHKDLGWNYEEEIRNTAGE